MAMMGAAPDSPHAATGFHRRPGRRVVDSARRILAISVLAQLLSTCVSLLPADAPSIADDGAVPALDVPPPPAGNRLVVNLGGVWEFAPAERIADPPKDGWFRITIAEKDSWQRNHWGKHNSDWSAAPCGWYRRRLVLPEGIGERPVILRFGAVHAEAEVFLNGTHVGRHAGGLTPFEIDISATALPGRENELLVGCRGPLAAGLESQPRGAMYRFHAGIWQAVHLEIRQPLHIDTTFVTTRVDRRQLTVRTTLANTSGRPAAVVLSHHVLDADQAILTVPPAEVTLQAGARREIVQRLVWRNLRLWSPADPHLYDLQSEVRLSGSPVDRVRTRFGVRQVSIDGPRLFLNGRAIRLKATWGHSGEWYYGRPRTIGATLQVLKDHNINTVRYHGQPLPPAFYAAADEVGMLVVAESALYHGPGGENALRHTREWIVRDRNHPSIVIWSGSNEFGHWIVPRDPARTAFLLEQEALIRSLDPTRPVMQHGYGSLDGREEIYNIHYPERALAMQPNCFRWPLDRTIEINPAYTGFDWKREKPLAIGEHLLGCAGLAALFAGDTAYGAGRDWTYAAQLFEHALNVYRHQGVAHVAPQVFQSSPGGKSVPNPYLSALAPALRPEGLFFTNLTAHARSGEAISKQLTIFNETMDAHSYRVSWRFSLGDRENAHQGDAPPMDLAAGETGAVGIRLTMPTVRQITPARLSATLHPVDSGAAPIDSAHLEMHVFPLPQAPSTDHPVALFDPGGETAPVFSSLGVRARQLPALTEASLNGIHTLVLGRHSLASEVIAAKAALLERYVHAGGHVLSLEQDRMPRWLPVPIQMIGENGSPSETTAFGTQAAHPLTRGLHLEAFSYWRPDHIVTRRSLAKPNQGNVRSLLSSNRDLGRAPVLEIPVGAGCYLICQLEVVGAFEQEPMAAEMLGRMLSYLDSRPASRWSDAALIGTADSSLARFLETDLKADVPVGAAPPGAAPDERLVIVDAAVLTEAATTGLRAAAERGATLVIHGVTPDSRRHLGALLSREITLAAASPDPVRLVHGSPATLGMTHFDTAWQDPVGRRLSRERGAWLALIGGDARPLSDPAGWLTAVSVGNGTVIVNQFLFDRETYDTDSARRFASLLFTNLGLWMRSLSLLPINEKGWSYLDLRPFCNARLKATHGNDLRNLPTGQAEFRGVPFYVLDHDENDGLGAVRIDNVLRLDDGTTIGGGANPLTDVSGIPVRMRVGRLAFLHMAGFNHGLSRYAKPRIAEYIVQYRQGGRDVIPVRSGEEVINWWTDWAQDLPNAKLAWKGSNPRTDKIAVFMVEWSNPFPEREVESISVRSCANPPWSPMLIAVSALEIE